MSDFLERSKRFNTEFAKVHNRALFDTVEKEDTIVIVNATTGTGIDQSIWLAYEEGCQLKNGLSIIVKNKTQEVLTYVSKDMQQTDKVLVYALLMVIMRRNMKIDKIR